MDDASKEKIINELFTLLRKVRNTQFNSGDEYFSNDQLEFLASTFVHQELLGMDMRVNWDTLSVKNHKRIN